MWALLGTVQPGLQWQAVGGIDGILVDLETVLIRVSHSYTEPPAGSAHLRQFFLNEDAVGWYYKLYPSTDKRIFRVSVPPEFRAGGNPSPWEPQIRLRRFSKAPSSTNWQITLEARLP